MLGRDDHLPHSLVPLVLAVAQVRSRLADAGADRAAGADPDTVATLIASAVPVFEYWDTPLRLPRHLPSALRDGVFRDGGRELRFLDGRPTKNRIAVRVEDLDCVVEILMYPERAIFIRNRVLRTHARKLVSQSRDLGAHAAELRGAAEKALTRALRVWKPMDPFEPTPP